MAKALRGVWSSWAATCSSLALLIGSCSVDDDDGYDFDPDGSGGAAAEDHAPSGRAGMSSGGAIGQPSPHPGGGEGGGTALFDPCTQKPCRNGGICQTLETGFYCLCPPDADGPTCEGQPASGGAGNTGGQPAIAGGGTSSETGGAASASGGAAPGGAGDSDGGTPSTDPCSSNPCLTGQLRRVDGDDCVCEEPAFEWLIPPEGWSSCGAYHASRDGSVIVGACSKAPDFRRGFRWTRAEGAVALGTLGESHYAWRVSGDGKVIAGNYDNGDEAGFYLWTAEDGMVPYRAFDDEDVNSMNDLSSDGSVVVGYSVTFDDANNTTYRAFRWTKQDCTDLGRINPGDTHTEANGVNGDGTIIVGSNHLDTFRWTAETGLVVLPKAPYGADTMDAISADGTQIAGHGSDDGYYYGLRWSDSSVEILDGLGQQVRGVSDTGIITALDFVYDGEVLSAADAIAARGIEVPDGTVTRVVGVTPNGKFWLGSGSNGAFVVRLP